MLPEPLANQRRRRVAKAPGINAGEGQQPLAQQPPADRDHDGKHGKGQDEAAAKLMLFALHHGPRKALDTGQQRQDGEDQGDKRQGAEHRQPPGIKGVDQYQQGKQHDEVQYLAEQLRVHGHQRADQKPQRNKDRVVGDQDREAQGKFRCH
ncbi:hypothetical protein SDC9_171009 [bioreactor metagenome]|uniref:Uncharacterized protein n=1 Tax=bioreactor metagenome TaxID=1076179 RepID=A0A645GBX0_9ZZZZ